MCIFFVLGIVSFYSRVVSRASTVFPAMLSSASSSSSSSSSEEEEVAVQDGEADPTPADERVDSHGRLAKTVDQRTVYLTALTL